MPSRRRCSWSPLQTTAGAGEDQPALIDLHELVQEMVRALDRLGVDTARLAYADGADPARSMYLIDATQSIHRALISLKSLIPTAGLTTT